MRNRGILLLTAMTAAVWMATAARPAWACSPLEPFTVAQLATPDQPTRPVGVVERLHYSFEQGQPGRITSASISTGTRTWGVSAMHAGEAYHGGLLVDETDTCGTPSGSAPGTYEYYASWGDGDVRILDPVSGSGARLTLDEELTLADLFGEPLVVADPAELLAVPPLVQPGSDDNGRRLLVAGVVGVLGLAVIAVARRHSDAVS